MSGFVCLLYTVFHPFIAMKIIFGANVSFYCIILMQILYKSRRPSWEEWDTNNKDKKNIKWMKKMMRNLDQFH